MSDVQLINVGKRFPNGYTALQNIGLEFEEGTLTYLIGRSGAGKTTMLNLIVGTMGATEGQVLVNGIDVCSMRRHHLAWYRRNVGCIMEGYGLLDYRPVFDNVAMPLWVAGWTKKNTKRRVEEVLEQVGLLNCGPMDTRWLSRGERQRVLIARAFVNDPQLILADEPTGSLDSELSERVMRLLQHMKRKRRAIIIATHDRDLIEAMGGRIVVLDRTVIDVVSERRMYVGGSNNASE